MFNLNLPSNFMKSYISMPKDEVTFYGHMNIQSLHPRTIEITKDAKLSLRGDCIVGVRANKSCSDLNYTLKRALKNDGSLAKIEIIVGNSSFEISGRGDKELSLFSRHDIVIRKSSFVCPRTMSISCDKASCDIPREMILSLKDPATKGIFMITVE
jgi:uncharacterized protein